MHSYPMTTKAIVNSELAEESVQLIQKHLRFTAAATHP